MNDNAQIKPLIALAAGGTGGHMFPASVLAVELQRRGFDILLLTDKRGMAYEHVFAGCSVVCIESKSPMQGGLVGRVKSALGLLSGSMKAAKILRKNKAKAVVGFGGYASLPAIVGARLIGVPYGMHEQNAVLGRVNRLLVGGAGFLATSFKDTRRVKDKTIGKTVVTGNPTREDICKVGEVAYKLPADDEPFKILAVGGSLGAKIFADVIPAALTFLDSEFKANLLVTQQCRPEDQQRVEQTYKRSGIKSQTPKFIDDMATALNEAHLIISRGGAGSVTEAALAGRPAIIVPLAIAADNHQTYNARNLSENRAGWSITEDEFLPGPLAALIGGLITANDQLLEAATNARALSKPNATSELANLVEEKLLNKNKDTKENTTKANKKKTSMSKTEKRVAA